MGRRMRMKRWTWTLTRSKHRSEVHLQSLRILIPSHSSTRQEYLILVRHQGLSKYQPLPTADPHPSPRMIDPELVHLELHCHSIRIEMNRSTSLPVRDLSFLVLDHRLYQTLLRLSRNEEPDHLMNRDCSFPTTIKLSRCSHSDQQIYPHRPEPH